MQKIKVVHTLMQTLTNLTQMCSSMQSVPIITKVVSSNRTHGEV